MDKNKNNKNKWAICEEKMMTYLGINEQAIQDYFKLQETDTELTIDSFLYYRLLNRESPSDLREILTEDCAKRVLAGSVLLSQFTDVYRNKKYDEYIKEYDSR